MAEDARAASVRSMSGTLRWERNTLCLVRTSKAAALYCGPPHSCMPTRGSTQKKRNRILVWEDPGEQWGVRGGEWPGPSDEAPLG